MNYHVLMELGNQHHWWANYSYEQLIQDLIIPFINKQVITVNYNNKKAILNLSSITYLVIYKTNEPLDVKKDDISSKFRSSDFQQNICTQEIIEKVALDKSSKDFKSLLQYSFSIPTQQVFVVMKFNDKVLDSAYNGVMKPIIKKFKYTPLRIDEIQNSGKINDQILEEIAKSRIVLADLTGERPNCYYEAGFAHAIGKEVIFTIKKGSPVHFDLIAYRFIEWETEDELRSQLTKRFKAIQTKIEQK